MTESRSKTDATVTARERTSATERPSSRPSARPTARLTARQTARQTARTTVIPTVETTARPRASARATESVPNLHQFLDYHLRQISKWLGGGL